MTSSVRIEPIERAADAGEFRLARIARGEEAPGDAGLTSPWASSDSSHTASWSSTRRLASGVVNARRPMSQAPRRRALGRDRARCLGALLAKFGDLEGAAIGRDNHARQGCIERFGAGGIDEPSLKRVDLGLELRCVRRRLSTSALIASRSVLRARSHSRHWPALLSRAVPRQASMRSTFASAARNALKLGAAARQFLGDEALHPLSAP